jgi:hypothetical protein
VKRVVGFKTHWNNSLWSYRDVESELAAMKAEHDRSHRTSLFRAVIIALSPIRKSGKRREMMARLGFNTPANLPSREHRRMGAPDGSSCESVKTNWAGALPSGNQKPVAIELCLIRQSLASPIVCVHQSNKFPAHTP